MCAIKEFAQFQAHKSKTFLCWQIILYWFRRKYCETSKHMTD